MMQQEYQNKSFAVAVEGEEAHIRLLSATSARCSFAFVSGQGTAALFRNLVNDGNQFPTNAPVRGLYLSSSSHAQDSFENMFLPPRNFYRESIGLPAQCIVIPELPRNACREDRIEWGSTVYHEYTHSKGAREYGAFRAQDDYLKRNGLPVRFPDDEALFLFLRDHPLYGEDEEFIARFDSVAELLEREV